ncbi:hypothetical protein [Noviherbaspirillum sp.]|uniref:hypothetical protein n=1 Tax=Noviherbaspirillum sp. TaxID=1926288 RepID=UPI002FE37BEE
MNRDVVAKTLGQYRQAQRMPRMTGFAGGGTPIEAASCIASRMRVDPVPQPDDDCPARHR